MAKKNLSLLNATPIDLFWSFSNPEELSKFLEFSQCSGTLKLYSVQDIELKYKPMEEEIIPKKNVEIQASILKGFHIKTNVLYGLKKFTR